MRLIECDETYSDAILAIFNDAIATSTALYDDEPRTPEVMAAWFEAKRRGGFPVIAAVDEAGELMGFASYGPFRSHAGYRYTVEHSLYVARPHRGRGLGRVLLEAIVERASTEGYRVMIGVIDSENTGSIALHEQFGFRLSGTLQQVGFKFDRWLDVCLYQLVLVTQT